MTDPQSDRHDAEVAVKSGPPLPGAAGEREEPRGFLSKKWMKPLMTLAIVVAVLTTFDGVATWFEVEVLKIAEEANPLLRYIESLVGFTGSMVVRVVAGLALLAAIVYGAHRGRERARRLFVLGLSVCAVYFSLLDIFHIVILSYFNF